MGKWKLWKKTVRAICTFPNVSPHFSVDKQKGKLMRKRQKRKVDFFGEYNIISAANTSLPMNSAGRREKMKNRYTISSNWIARFLQKSHFPIKLHACTLVLQHFLHTSTTEKCMYEVSAICTLSSTDRLVLWAYNVKEWRWLIIANPISLFLSLMYIIIHSFPLTRSIHDLQFAPRFPIPLTSFPVVLYVALLNWEDNPIHTLLHQLISLFNVLLWFLIFCTCLCRSYNYTLIQQVKVKSSSSYYVIIS